MRCRGVGEPLLEREAELDLVSAALADAVGGGGRMVAVVGPPGIGKTSLLQALLDRARAPEGAAHVCHASGSEFEREFPFAIARELLAPTISGLPDSDEVEVLEGAATLGARAIGVDGGIVPDAVQGQSLFAAVHGLYWLAANLAERKPLVLVVDDAQWADPESLRWISYLGRRLDEIPVLVALAARVAEPGTDWDLLQNLLRDSGASVVEPQPLSPGAVERMIAGRLDMRPEPGFVRACEEVTGGNPYLLDELLISLAEQGVSPVDAESGRVSRLEAVAISQPVLDRVARVGPVARRLAKAAAILGQGCELALARAVADLDWAQAESAADSLAQASVIEHDLPIRFVHPLVRAAVHNSIPPAERALGHARAARLLVAQGAAVEEVAAHLLAADPRGEGWVVERLREAAAGALVRGVPVLAARYLRRALAEPPPASERVAVLLELGAAEVTVGDAQSAVDHLREAADLASETPEHAAAQRGEALALLNLGRPDEGIRRLAAAIAEHGDGDQALRLGLEADLASLEVVSMSADHRAARERLEGLAGGLDGGDPAEGVLLAALAHLRMGACEPASEVADLAERALAVDAPAEPGPAVIGRAEAMVTLLCADAVEAAERIAGADLAAAMARGATFEVSLNHLFLAVAALMRGSMSDAEARARHVLDLAREHGLPAEVGTAAAVVTEARIERGEVDAAWAELDALGMTGELPALNTFSWVLARRGRLRAAMGEAEAGLADLMEAGRRYASWGILNPSEARWRSDAAAIALVLGDVGEARRLTEEELALARRFGAPRTLGIALRARAIVEGGARGISLLEEAVLVLGGSIARLEHAHALVELGAALRRANRRADARDPLRAGLELARACGAIPLAERAYDELLATGSRPRKIVRSGVDSLTPSELRVARMAAEGMQNKAIAQALFVTVRTVETHLRHAYQKLEISSRGELPAALGGEPAGPGPGVGGAAAGANVRGRH